MNIIKLTSLNHNSPIYINVDCIGHFIEVEEKIQYGRVEKEKHTRIGVTTHNNGGFEVKESAEVIIALTLDKEGHEYDETELIKDIGEEAMEIEEI
jgi:hypothetical protein